MVSDLMASSGILSVDPGCSKQNHKTDSLEVGCQKNPPNVNTLNRRGNKFNDDWMKDFSWLKPSRDEFKAKCIACGSDFSILNGGITDVKKHMKTSKHQSKLTSFSKQRSVTYYSKANSKSARAEAAFTYHTIIHSHSYNSADCSSKLFATLFPDSAVAREFSCGRTKCTKINSNVLAKFSVMTIIDDLSKNRPYSVSTDASNKGNIKTFPIILRYFRKEKGLQIKLLSFFQLESEKSQDISNMLKLKLKKSGLSLLNATSFCADNASVNFGKNQSVFVELKKENPRMLGIGCLCHVIHNSIKNSLPILVFDVEVIVMKIYNHFSSSTKRTASLKAIFEFCDLQWCEMLRHVPTRWLSLVPAVERLLKNFEAIKSYFTSLECCPPVLNQFFENEIAEAYLGLIANIGNSLTQAIKKLEENNNLVIIDMFSVMKNLRDKIHEQREQAFYGSIADSICKKSDDMKAVRLFKKRASAFLLSIDTYLQTHFDFNNNIFEKLNIFRLESDTEFQNFKDICEAFSIKHIDYDCLFEEFVMLKGFLPTVKEKSVEEKWMTYLNSGNYPNFEKICEFIFSIPHSNAATERLFSLMFNSWRDDRNKLCLENVECELQVKTNYKLNCEEFYDFLGTAQGIKICQQVQKADKYLN